MKEAVIFAFECAYDRTETYMKQVRGIEKFPEDLIVHPGPPIFDFWKMNNEQIRGIDLSDEKSRAGRVMRKNFRKSLDLLCRNVHNIR